MDVSGTAARPERHLIPRSFLIALLSVLTLCGALTGWTVVYVSLVMSLAPIRYPAWFLLLAAVLTVLPIANLFVPQLARNRQLTLAWTSLLLVGVVFISGISLFGQAR